jgi:hypothetical protein
VLLAVLLPAPGEEPGFNELSRSVPVSGQSGNSRKMLINHGILALFDSKIGNPFLHDFCAFDVFCINFERRKSSK